MGLFCPAGAGELWIYMGSVSPRPSLIGDGKKDNMPSYGFQQNRRSVVQLIIRLFSRPAEATSLIFVRG
jgi:hypothetical protein